jgi:hypothetical protein
MMYREKYGIFWCSLNWRLRGTLLQDILSGKPGGIKGGEEKVMVSRSVENERGVEVENAVPDD